MIARTICSCLAIAAFSGMSARAAESYSSCTGYVGAPLPATISAPGNWCLKSDLPLQMGASQTAITIAADNVTLDCNHFAILGGGSGQIGIYAKDRSRVTVRNCGVTNVDTGIFLQATTASSGGKYLVEDDVVDNVGITGIRVEGDHSVVRRNQVSNVGITTQTAGKNYGIFSAYSVDVLDNSIATLKQWPPVNGSTYGIYTTSAASGSIDRNRIRGLSPSGTGSAFGIFNAGSGRITLRDNTLVGNGTAGSIGISCTSGNARATHNVLGGFATGLRTCGDAGDNDITP